VSLSRPPTTNISERAEMRARSAKFWAHGHPFEFQHVELNVTEQTALSPVAQRYPASPRAEKNRDARRRFLLPRPPTKP